MLRRQNVGKDLLCKCLTRKIRSSKVLGFLTYLRVSNGSNDSDDCISINRTARIYSTKFRMLLYGMFTFRRTIFLGQPTKDLRWQHQKKPRSLPSVVRRYRQHTNRKRPHNAIFLFAVKGLKKLNGKIK